MHEVNCVDQVLINRFIKRIRKRANIPQGSWDENIYKEKINGKEETK